MPKEDRLLRSSRPRKMKAVIHASFRTAGMRLTRQRLAIYRELESRQDHPDVDTLFRAVKPRIPQISLFTVYRTMNALEMAGMVRRVATWKGHARYDGLLETHAHFLCETCGSIHDIDLDANDLVPLCAKVTGDQWSLRRADVMFYGIGPLCLHPAAEPQT